MKTKEDARDALLRYSPSVLGPKECPYNHDHGPFCDDAEAMAAELSRLEEINGELMAALAELVECAPHLGCFISRCDCRISRARAALGMMEEEMTWSNPNDVGQVAVERAESLSVFLSAARAENAALKEKIGEAVEVIGQLIYTQMGSNSCVIPPQEASLRGSAFLARLAEPAQKKPMPLPIDPELGPKSGA